MNTLKRITTILVDGDGVLWHAAEAVPGMREFLTSLDALGLQWALLTNNNTQTVQTYVDKLGGFGVPANRSQVFTSSAATAAYLLRKHGGPVPLHVVGMDGLINTLRDAGFPVYTGEQFPPEQVAAVVAGMDRALTHDKVKVAMRLILAGAEFIATNTDGSFVTPEGFNPGTGMVIGALQATTGVTPLVIGKPEAAIFQAALDHYGCQPQDALMVGDRLNTDILGASRLGIHTAAVLTGVTSRAEIAESPVKPDLIYADVAELHQALLSALK